MIRTPSFAALAASAALLLGGCTTTNNYNYPDKARAAAPAASETQAAGKAKNLSLIHI